MQIYITSTLTDFALTVTPSLYIQDHIHHSHPESLAGGCVPLVARCLQATANPAGLRRRGTSLLEQHAAPRKNPDV